MVRTLTAFFSLLFMMSCVNTVLAADTIAVRDARATAAYWVSRNQDGDRVLLDEDGISSLNAGMMYPSLNGRTLSRLPLMSDLLTYPGEVASTKVIAEMRDLWPDESVESIDGLRTSTDADVTGAALAEALANRGISDIAANVPVRYAVAAARLDVRLLPVGEGWFDDSTKRYDMLQGTVFDPAEALIVLADSRDGQYVYVQSHDYRGWVRRIDVVFTDRETWLSYANPEDFLVVTANKVPLSVRGRKVIAQMGAVLPLVSPTPSKGHWQVKIPYSNGGQPSEATVLVPVGNKVNRGFLPYTENNLVRQAFRFLGDEYGWGGMDESVDCSSFVQDVYRSVGVNIPRDADQQEEVMPQSLRLDGEGTPGRQAVLSRTPPGALLFKPGHVMMYLGKDDKGEPMVIHSASSYFTFTNGAQKHYVRQVLVSDLHYENSRQEETIDSLTSIGVVK